MNGQYNIGDVVLGSWTLVRLLGEGAYGRVYEAHRVEYQNTYTAAVKIMTIPSSPSEIESARAEGMDDESIRAYFDGFVGSVVNEFTLMSELKGTANIVSCEDFRVIPHTEGLGWDILIRMELLTPMLKYMSGREMTRSDVIKLGVDMCRALELCQRYNIIHRDIKPENIFLSRTGDYKLGDFGVARTLEKTTGGLSKKGTYTYMAPEIYRDEKYGPTVDIYSLGIVLYRLLNNNRAPLLPPPPQPITHGEREKALLRRISGEELPPPANADDRLGEIVLKACAFEARDRYQSPQQMRQELEAIQDSAGDAPLYESKNPIRVERSQYTGHSNSADSVPGKAATGKKKKTGLLAAIAAALVLGAIALLVLLPKLRQSDPSVSASPAPVEETAPPVETPEATPEPEPTPEPTPEPVYEPEPAEEPEADAEEPWVEGDWNWTLEDLVLTISGTGNMANYRSSIECPWIDNAVSVFHIVIKDGITGIGENAFRGCRDLSSVTIPKSVVSIGEGAFYGCRFHSSVTIPESVSEIGVGAFAGCDGRFEVSLDSPYFKSVDGVIYSADGKTLVCYPFRKTGAFQIPDGVTAIGAGAFYNCERLTAVTIPESVVSIGEKAFCGCLKLRTVTIPASVTEIGAGAFSWCEKLTKIEVAPDSPAFCSIGGALYTKDGKTLLCFPGGSALRYQIPEGVTAIGDEAFCGCHRISSVTIPGSVTSIGDRAFMDCQWMLTKLTIPEGVTSIGDEAFRRCESLGRISLPASLAVIGRDVFRECEMLSKLEVAEDNPYLKAINNVLFTKDGKTLLCYPMGRSGSNYAVPQGVTAISDYAFSCCKLTKLTIPEGVTSIGEYAFDSSSKLESVAIPETVSAFGAYAFFYCEKLNAVTIPAGLSVIENGSFSGCRSLRSVSIPEGVTLIGDNAFRGCESITTVNLPQSLAKVGPGAFHDCSWLRIVNYKGSRPLWITVRIEDLNDPLKNASVRFGAS